MLTAKERFLTILRDKNSDRASFRRAAIKITEILVFEAMQHLDWKRADIETPLEKTAGIAPSRPTALIPILRSGLAMLPHFEAAFPDSKIGFLGFQRDEHTFLPTLYYDRLPAISKETEVLLLDPMLATGGTADAAIEVLKKKGINEERLILVSIIAAPDGAAIIERKHPKVKLVIGTVDRGLNSKKFIVPGIGDFGDRYFGTDDYTEDRRL